VIEDNKFTLYELQIIREAILAQWDAAEKQAMSGKDISDEYISAHDIIEYKLINMMAETQ
jgi:hypothetical protein